MTNLFMSKKNNALNILKTIKNNGQATKPEIAAFTGLTSVSVHNFVNELVEKNIILEEGNAGSNGGRRAVLYRFNSNLYNIIGINIAVKYVTVSLFDLDLNILDSITKKSKLELLNVDEGIRLIVDMVNSLMDKLNVKSEKIAGIGVSVPGPVNYEKGLIYELPNLPKWRNIPIKDILENELGMPVHVDKDINGMLLGLKWKNVLKNSDNVVYLVTIEGIGTGILLNSEIYRGNRCAAGEVGHLTVDINGPRCNCGNYGCIELYASDLAIINGLSEQFEEEKESILYKLCEGDVSRINMSNIVEAAKQGDLQVKETLRNAGKYLGICINNILKTYAPMEVVIESTWLGEFNDIYYSILDYVYETSNFFERSHVRITLNAFENIYFIGSATTVLDNLFKTHENNKLLAQIG